MGLGCTVKPGNHCKVTYIGPVRGIRTYSQEQNSHAGRKLAGLRVSGLFAYLDKLEP